MYVKEIFMKLPMKHKEFIGSLELRNYHRLSINCLLKTVKCQATGSYNFYILTHTK